MGPNENMGPTGKVWYHGLASMRGENWIWFETGFRSGLGLVSVESSPGSQYSQPVSFGFLITTMPRTPYVFALKSRAAELSPPLHFGGDEETAFPSHPPLLLSLLQSELPALCVRRD